MDSKGRINSVWTYAAAVAAVTLIILIGPGRSWLFGSGKPPVRAVVSDAPRSLVQTRERPTQEAFERTMIRDAAKTPFKEMFDLLRSASTKQRLSWIKQLDEMPTGPRRTVLLSNFYKIFVQLDPHAAAESITILKQKGAKELAAGAMVGAIPPSGMAEMAVMLARFSEDTFTRDTSFYLMQAIDGWSAIDPESTARFLEANPDVGEPNVDCLLSNWGRLNPEAAREWLESQPESVQTRGAFESLLDGWLSRDEPAAIAFAIEHASEEKFSQAIANTAKAIYLRSPDDARAFFLRLPKEAWDKTLFEFELSTSAKYDPTILWQRKAEDIARWMITLPQDSWTEAQPLSHVLSNWESQDPTGLSRWLDELPPESRDSVVETFGLHRGSIERAIPLLLTIKDPGLRDQAIRKYVDEWFPEPSNKVVRTIAESGLSEEQRQYLIERLPKRE